ncbi:ExbD/TolR family protein [Jiulongibacter sediminis]|uniref:Biopolymer transporter ExbD n=1 Tax=Jiulongibacter sediminis TaxID=1605367 RepID=A0A0P7BRH2_9BACT|nr:biopolymer transporter ExbD [Jiulongibacter sediminis]KPM46893.1 biopolymer transporter ExbD [Jiulongibacter sediminis]TBX22243.1 biopolymer transporter ExbD [Jiulongibacter sediminis]
MAAVKPKRHGPSMDMTAMCDVAFLLLTFFIMASSFKSEETVTIETPSSISEELIPETDVCMVSIDTDGKYYFGITDATQRDDFAKALSDKYNLGLTNAEMVAFTSLAEVGVPMKQLKNYVNLSEAQRVKVELEGIPLDSTDSELVDWVKTYGETFAGSKIAVRGDGNTPYPALKNLFDEFGRADLNKFQLITKIEKQ